MVKKPRSFFESLELHSTSERISILISAILDVKINLELLYQGTTKYEALKKTITIDLESKLSEFNHEHSKSDKAMLALYENLLLSANSFETLTDTLFKLEFKTQHQLFSIQENTLEKTCYFQISLTGENNHPSISFSIATEHITKHLDSLDWQTVLEQPSNSARKHNSLYNINAFNTFLILNKKHNYGNFQRIEKNKF